MAFHSNSISIWTVLAILCAKVMSTNPCFFPNGDTASNFVPCSPNGDGGCCASGDFCTGFGYCISNSKGYHYRGACTDDTWGNPSCPDYCLTNENSGNSSAVNVIACNGASTSGSWCCAYDGNCCSSSTFVPTFGTIFAEPGTSSTSSSSAASTSSSSSSSLSSTIASTSATTTPTTSAQSAQNTTTTSTSTSSKSNTGAVVGAAVGVPLGLAALAGLFLFYRERNKRKKMQHELPEKNSSFITSEGYNNNSPQNSYGQVATSNGHDEIMGDNMLHGQSTATNADNGMMRGIRPLTKRYEMDTQTQVELPGHEPMNAQSLGDTTVYDHNLQHGP